MIFAFRSARLAVLALACTAVVAPAQRPTPTVRDITYATTDSASRAGHLLDLYLPSGATRPTPVVIFSSGSAWLANNGRDGAPVYAAQLNKLGYAVAGDSISFLFRYSATNRFHTTFVYDRAADRWQWHMDNDSAGVRKPFARVTLTRR